MAPNKKPRSPNLGGARPGAGRKPKFDGPSKPWAVRLPAELADAIKENDWTDRLRESTIRQVRRWLRDKSGTD